MEGIPAEDINVYSSKDTKCPSCGGKLVFDPVGQVLKCGFCGSPAIITRRHTKQFRPDYLIPFKITKEEAKDKFVEFAQGKKNSPARFFQQE